MTREARQREILTLLDKETGISAGDLAQRFHVSRMTIHRDLRSLLKQGLLFRIQGGAVKKGIILKGVAAKNCTFCRRQLLPHQCSEITRTDGTVDVACCPACALRQFNRNADAEQFLVGDQITGKMVLAEDAYFLINSLVSPCCQPSLLSFVSKAEVTLFQAGFGGSIARLDEALEFLRVAESLNGG
jgi:biotin operon repressor